MAHGSQALLLKSGLRAQTPPQPCHSVPSASKNGVMRSLGSLLKVKSWGQHPWPMGPQPGCSACLPCKVVVSLAQDCSVACDSYVVLNIACLIQQWVHSRQPSLHSCDN